MQALSQSATNPVLGVLIFTMGGLAGAVFYLPFKKVKNWAWESYWLIYAVCGLVLAPVLLALTTSPNLTLVLRAAPGNEIVYCLVCGAVWGFGGLTWGLMIRYLGVGLGLAIGAGLTSSVGTLIPPMLGGKNAVAVMFTTPSGIVSVIAAGVSLAGIVLVGLAGMSKEAEVSAEQKRTAVAEFNFRKGIVVALFSGVMSSAMSFGLQGGPTIERLAATIEPPASVVWAGMPVLAVVLFGGFIVNGVWCIFLNIRNKTAGDYVRKGTPLGPNLLFAAAAGAIWSSQFVAFKTGEPQMGRTAYIGWAVLMASQILFSQLLGIYLGEWKGTSRKTTRFLALGLLLLLASTVVAAYSSRMAVQG